MKFFNFEREGIMGGYTSNSFDAFVTSSILSSQQLFTLFLVLAPIARLMSVATRMKSQPLNPFSLVRVITMNQGASIIVALTMTLKMAIMKTPLVISRVSDPV